VNVATGARAAVVAVVACVATTVATAELACSPAVRDVVPETHDVRGDPGPAKADAGSRTDGYEHVARRSRVAVGLVGFRHLTFEEAKRAIDRIADDLEACARAVEKRGELAVGAAQLVVMAGPRGTSDVTDMRLAPGGPVAANALECLIAPLRSTPLAGASADAGGPATLAIEATWEPSTPVRNDAGASR